MKNTKTPAEKPATTTKPEAVSAPTPKAAAKKTSPAKPAAKKPEVAATEVPAATAKPAETSEASPKKSTPAATAPKKAAPAKAKTATPSETAPELAMSERVGLTAGSIWQYLSSNGPTSVAKLLAALDEEEKIIQRSIGWLAQEDKIAIAIDNRIETVSLK